MGREALRKNWKNALLRRIRFYVFAAAACLLSAHLLASVWHPFEWATHFTPHVSLFIVAGAYFLPRYWRACFFCAGLSLLAFALGPFSGGARNQVGAESGARILSYNLKFDNAGKEAEARLIADADADIVVLIEAGGPAWRGFLETLKKDYPHSCGHDADGPFALRLLSKQAPASCEVKYSGIYPYIRAELPDHRALFALHPPPPVDGELAEQRNRYFRETAAHIEAEQHPVLVVGDFNNSPFSPVYRRFAAIARVRDALPRALPTWKPFLFPIDRALYRQGAVSARALPWRHSDHRPLLVEWRTSPARPNRHNGGGETAIHSLPKEAHHARHPPE